MLTQGRPLVSVSLCLGSPAADRIATYSEARGDGMDLIVAGIGVAICFGYIAWRY